MPTSGVDRATPDSYAACSTLTPYSTVQRHFYDGRDSGLLQTIRFNLAMKTRELEGREAQPTAGVIDSQSVKTTESGGLNSEWV